MEHAEKALRRLRKESARRLHPGGGTAPYLKSPESISSDVDEVAYTGRLIELYMGRYAPERLVEDALDPLSVMTGAAMQMAERSR